MLLHPFRKPRIGRVCLPPTPEARHVIDPFDELDLSSTKSSRRSKRSRYLIISASIALWLLVLVIYIADVERSWRALENKWMVNTKSAESGELISNVTKIWGHSHNDEMHGKDAFTVALGLGFGSIEADTWLVDQHGAPRLMVGHVPVDLERHRTLQTVYLDPILEILEERNADRLPTETWVGLLKDDPTADIQLVIDFAQKSDGPTMWPFVLEALQPLSKAGYLTTYDTQSRTFNRGPITIIGTGNTPLSHVYYSSVRSIFYDAPLRKLSKLAHIPASSAGPAIQLEIDNTLSPMASAKIPAWAHIGAAFYPVPNGAVGWMRRRTDEARKRGIQSRWWGAANKPAWIRRRMWALQKEAETDWINGDDLRDLARWLRRNGK